MRAKPSTASAEGGNRTLIPVGNTILSRARLPSSATSACGAKCQFALRAPKYTTPDMKVKIKFSGA